MVAQHPLHRPKIGCHFSNEAGAFDVAVAQLHAGFRLCDLSLIDLGIFFRVIRLQCDCGRGARPPGEDGQGVVVAVSAAVVAVVQIILGGAAGQRGVEVQLVVGRQIARLRISHGPVKVLIELVVVEPELQVHGVAQRLAERKVGVHARPQFTRAAPLVAFAIGGGSRDGRTRGVERAGFDPREKPLVTVASD